MRSSRWMILLSVFLMAAQCEDAASESKDVASTNAPIVKVAPTTDGKLAPVTDGKLSPVDGKFSPATDGKVAPIQDGKFAPSTYQPPRNDDNGPVTVEDIERWRRGMVAELASVKSSIAKLKASLTAVDSLDNMTATTETATLETGARAAGLSNERYNFVRSTMQSAVTALAPTALLTNLTPAMIAEFKKNGEEQIAGMSADIPPNVVAALRPLSDGFAKQNMALAVERLCAVGQCKR